LGSSRRRLKATGTAAPNEEVRQLSIVDFGGIFLIFALMTIVIVVGHEAQVQCGEYISIVNKKISIVLGVLCKCLTGLCRGKVHSKAELSDKITKALTRTDLVIDEFSVPSELREKKDPFDLRKVNTDNECQMLTVLLRQMVALRSEIKAEIKAGQETARGDVSLSDSRGAPTVPEESVVTVAPGAVPDGMVMTKKTVVRTRKRKGIPAPRSPKRELQIQTQDSIDSVEVSVKEDELKRSPSQMLIKFMSGRRLEGGSEGGSGRC